MAGRLPRVQRKDAVLAAIEATAPRLVDALRSEDAVHRMVAALQVSEGCQRLRCANCGKAFAQARLAHPHYNDGAPVKIKEPTYTSLIVEYVRGKDDFATTLELAQVAGVSLAVAQTICAFLGSKKVLEKVGDQWMPLPDDWDTRGRRITYTSAHGVKRRPKRKKAAP